MSLFLNIVSIETLVLHCITAICTLQAVSAVLIDQSENAYIFSIFKMEYSYQMELMIARGLSPLVMRPFFKKFVRTPMRFQYNIPKILSIISSVSYTHLTLPTNREV